MTRAKALMKGFFVLAFACVFILPMTASVTDAAMTAPVWGGSTFARGEYDQGYARTLVGTLDGKYASRVSRTYVNPGTIRETTWGSNNTVDVTLLFRSYVSGQSVAVFDPGQAAEADRGASATASLRDFKITYSGYTRAEIAGTTTVEVECPLNGARPTASLPVVTPLVLNDEVTFAMPEPGQSTGISIGETPSPIWVRRWWRGTLYHYQTITDRSAYSELRLELREYYGTSLAPVEVFNVTTTLVAASCGTSGIGADLVPADSLAVSGEPEEDEDEEEAQSDCKPYLLGIGGAGQRDYERANKPTFVGGILKRYSDRMETHSLDYPSSVWPLGPYTKDQSVAEGTEAAEELIRDYKERCPGGRVVVVGHSLGAEIAGNLARQVDRAVVFGDPRAPGGIYSAFSGIIPGISGPGERNPEPNLVSVCNEYSLICDCPAPWVDPLHFALSLQGFLNGKHNYDYSLDEALGIAPGHYFKQRENPNPALPEHLPLPDLGWKLPLPFELPEWKPGPLPNIQDLPEGN